MRNLRIFVVSDSVGETGELVVKAVVSQFRPAFENVILRRFPHINTIEHIEEIVDGAKKQHAVIVYTLVEKELRKALYNTSVENGVAAIDLLGPMMELIERSVDERPLERPGLVHQLDDYYFKKIEAIEFAVKYDDGRDPRGILLADIVLIGVSRTSKTPLSQYLAHKRYKVANVPLVPEVVPPAELFLVDPKKCFGLVISPQHLNNIRKERLIALGLTEGAAYAQQARIEEEIAYFYDIAQKVGCDVINVTNKAVEETANLIIETIEQGKIL
ncbi:pyruvate, water dikinase regulatory protein [Lysinibacillus sp. 54212]|uniref:pyruvate, water dikinase regulatory protein n=1 Tax=Lysinibacillus sp. 54212 TaxID=3119829 RepID=UPI002FCC7F82